MHGAYYVTLVLPLYFMLSYAATQLAIENPTHHDIIHLYDDYAAYAIPIVLIMSIFVAALSKPNYDLLLKRLSLMFMLKATSQILTIQPQPSGVQECIDEPIWKLKNCADMMFSGHTCFVYLVLYRVKFRWFLVFTMAFELVLADWHYMDDCFIAVIVGYAVEQKLS